MDDLIAIADSVGEEVVRRVLVQINAARALTAFDRAMAVRFAERLWHRRIEKRRIVEYIVARYEFSQATSYRIADEALENFSKRRDGEKRATDSDDVIEQISGESHDA